MIPDEIQRWRTVHSGPSIIDFLPLIETQPTEEGFATCHSLGPGCHCNPRRVEAHSGRVAGVIGIHWVHNRHVGLDA